MLWQYHCFPTARSPVVSCPTLNYQPVQVCSDLDTLLLPACPPSYHRMHTRLPSCPGSSPAGSFRPGHAAAAAAGAAVLGARAHLQPGLFCLCSSASSGSSAECLLARLFCTCHVARHAAHAWDHAIPCHRLHVYPLQFLPPPLQMYISLIILLMHGAMTTDFSPTLWISPVILPLQMYMLLIILLMLSQDTAFAQNVHKIVLQVCGQLLRVAAGLAASFAVGRAVCHLACLVWRRIPALWLSTAAASTTASG